MSLITSLAARATAHLKTFGVKAAGFTMIELLVVIAVIGVLAVAVLSSINPIEQINKGRDTRTRSDAAQLINAIDRYYAIHETYPWNIDNASAQGGGNGYTAGALDAFTPANPAAVDLLFDFSPIVGHTGAIVDIDWVDILVDTGEVKAGFTNRLRTDSSIAVLKEATSNATTYACFLPTSLAFKQEAMDNCTNGVTPTVAGATVVTCESTPAVLDEDNFICLP